MILLPKVLSIFVINTFFRGIISLGSLFFNITLISSLPVIDYGIFILTFTYITGLCVLNRFGLDNLILKNFGNYFLEKNITGIKTLIKYVNLFFISISLIIFSIIFTLYYFEKINFFINLEIVEYFYILSISIPFLSYLYLQRSSFRSIQYNTLSLLTELGAIHGFATLILLATIILNVNIDIFLICSVFNLSTIIIVIVAEYLKHQLIRKKIKVITTLKICTNQSFNFKKDLPDFVMNSFIQYLFQWIPIIIFGFYGLYESLAYFNATIALTIFVNFIYVSVVSFYATSYSHFYRTNNKTELKKKVHESSILMVTFGVPIGLFIIFFSYSIIRISYGLEYIEINYILKILVLSEIIALIIGPAHMVLAMSEFNSINKRINSFMCVIYIIILYLIIPNYGIFGVAICYFIIIVGKSAIASFYVRKKLGINTYFHLR